MANPVPLTLINSSDQTTPSRIVVGKTTIFSQPDQKASIGVYWYVVLDRTSLKAVANFVSDDTNNVPSALSQYLNNSQYLLLLLGNSVSTDDSGPPMQNLYAFLQEVGSGAALAELEQVVSATGSGTFQEFSYTLVAPMDGSGGFDYVFYNGPSQTRPYALQLIPLDNPGGGSFYTPQKLNGV